MDTRWKKLTPLEWYLEHIEMNKYALLTVFDENNKKWERMFFNSFSKFPHAKTIDYFPITDEVLKGYLRKDEHFFYRNKPQLMREYFKKGYEKVIIADVDQFVLGDWTELLERDDYDLAAPYNVNRVDPPQYGFIGYATIIPEEYLNAGFVVCANPDVAELWYKLCHSKHFDRCQFKEQDMLNVMMHYYMIDRPLFLDQVDYKRGKLCWWGLKSKGEGNRMVVRDGKVILPKGEDKYPPEDCEIKLYHVAGGKQKQDNFRIWFSEEVIDRIEELIK
jgi:hypothetical protein